MVDAYTPPGASSQYPTPRSGFDAVAAEIRDVKRRQDESERSRTLQSAAISTGGLTIKDGGGVTVKDGGVIRAEQPEGGYAEMFAGRVRFAANGDDAVGYISAGNSESSGGAVWPGMWIYPPYRPGLSQETRLVLLGQTEDSGGTVTGAIFGATDGNVQFEGRTGVLMRNTGAASARLVSTGGQVVLDSGINEVFITHGTTSSAANCVISTGGLIERSTSSLKYKQDVEDYNPGPDSVFALRPRTWRDRAEVERDPETRNRYVGFIAEEVHDAGLTDLVVYDADGNPDALSYDRFSAALLSVIRRQQDQIDTMRTELDELLRARQPEETT